MIKVTVIHQDNLIKSIEINGHAGSGPKGHDLVCAAVSAIITGGANALDNKKNYKVVLESGHALIEMKEKDEDGNKVLSTVWVMLKTVEESYSQFIKIEDKDN
ncbi:MAG: ribosomal-processing cysteine protease Prp [Erysipelotrichaceae bacterium]|jgi:hypothetical protein|nr:ribosomal-processing cysteine protease Prp [Erysipelotrichaceae bacterium]